MKNLVLILLFCYSMISAWSQARKVAYNNDPSVEGKILNVFADRQRGLGTQINLGQDVELTLLTYTLPLNLEFGIVRKITPAYDLGFNLALYDHTNVLRLFSQFEESSPLKFHNDFWLNLFIFKGNNVNFGFNLYTRSWLNLFATKNFFIGPQIDFALDIAPRFYLSHLTFAVRITTQLMDKLTFWFAPGGGLVGINPLTYLNLQQGMAQLWYAAGIQYDF